MAERRISPSFLHIAGCCSDGDALRTDHLATRGSRGIGSNQPVLLTALHTKECALSRHAQLIGNMSLELGKRIFEEVSEPVTKVPMAPIIGATRG